MKLRQGSVSMVALRCARKLYVLVAALSLLGGCSNGRGSLDGPPTPSAQSPFTIGASVTGLAGSGLVLQNNGGNDLAVSTNGAVTFSASVSDGTAYNVTVLSQPANPAQSCTVSNGSGRVAGANVTNVAVSCVTTGQTGSFAIGGVVNGLVGSGLVLQKNGTDDLQIVSNGSFTFTTPQPSGTSYEVTVKTQPANPAQTCTVEQGSGTVGSGDVRSVRVRCGTSAFSIGGTVSGLLGQGLRLSNNNDTVEVQSDGSFTFPTTVANGGSYAVSVATHPSNPTQSCSVGAGSGTVASANVTSVTVTCTTSEFVVGGQVSGLTGTGLVLRNNGGDDLTVTADGTFRFATTVPSGATYSVTVATQPTSPIQDCVLSSASGTVGAADVTGIRVTCTTIGFTVGGSVTNLSGSGLQLQNNGADTLAIAANGSFTFATPLLSGTPYNAHILTQPTNPSQTCSPSDGSQSGTVGNANVTSIAINCVTNTYSVGGTVSGLQGLGMILRVNGGDPLVISANGQFEFASPLPSGSTYDVTIASPPILPLQQCNVTNGTGTVGAADVTSVLVTCT